jgi:hypothetical protein
MVLAGCGAPLTEPTTWRPLDGSLSTGVPTDRQQLLFGAYIGSTRPLPPEVPPPSLAEYNLAIHEINDVLRSDRFRSAVLEVGDLGVSSSHKALKVSGKDVLDDLDHHLPTIRYVIDVDLGKRVTGQTGIETDGAITYLSDLTIGRIKSSKIGERACAINTLVHELTHAIPTEAGATSSKYIDSGHAHADHALVSYSIGSIAQCAYLELKTGVELSMTGMQACIADRGDRVFIADCDDQLSSAYQRTSEAR